MKSNIKPKILLHACCAVCMAYPVEALKNIDQKGYDTEHWRAYIAGLESEPEKGERCNKCFEFRLDKAAEKARDLNIQFFTTTLTVSPHKVSKNVFIAGYNAAKKYGVEFIDIDFKKQDGFLKTMQLAKENNFYRQQYCGCEFSIRA